jgi:aspartate carbamoyltransferase regulatory subunit
MKIDSIKNGIVLDHITAGKSMKIYKNLGLDDVDCSVAIIKNVKSEKMGKKDIIKMDDYFEINLDAIGYVDPNVTVCIIEDGKISKKYKVELPKRLINIAACKNPRCITSAERDLNQVFLLTDKENRIYRCQYCESKLKK